MFINIKIRFCEFWNFPKQYNKSNHFDYLKSVAKYVSTFFCDTNYYTCAFCLAFYTYCLNCLVVDIVVLSVTFMVSWLCRRLFLFSPYFTSILPYTFQLVSSINVDDCRKLLIFYSCFSITFFQWYNITYK